MRIQCPGWTLASGAAADLTTSVEGRRLLDGELAGLSGVAGEDLLVVIGPELPWVDGAVYLAFTAGCLPYYQNTAMHPFVQSRPKNQYRLHIDAYAPSGIP